MFASLSANTFYLGILLVSSLVVALAGGIVLKYLYDNFSADLFVGNAVRFTKKYFFLFGLGLFDISAGHEFPNVGKRSPFHCRRIHRVRGCLRL